jgi:hypothetical protein
MHFLNHLDCRAGFASATLRSQLKPCCNRGDSKCRHCERSEAIQQDKDAFFKSSGLPRRLRRLMELLANRLSQQAGKSLVIAMTRRSGLPRRLRLCHAPLAAKALLQ